MRNLLLCFSLLAGLSAGTLRAQAPASPETNYLFKNLKLPKLRCTGMLTDAGYVQSSIHGKAAHGFTMNMAAVLQGNWATGMWMDVQSARNIRLPVSQAVVKPSFTYVALGLSNELLIAPHRVVNVSLPLRLGVGLASYDDRGTYVWEYNGETWTQVPLNLMRGTYFIAEPGVNVSVNLFKHMSLSTGANYRFSAGNAQTGTGEDFSGLNLRAGLRFRITDDGSAGKCCCCKCN